MIGGVLTPRAQQLYERILDLAERRGIEGADPENEVGDLQTALRAALAYVPAAAVEAVASELERYMDLDEHNGLLPRKDPTP